MESYRIRLTRKLALILNGIDVSNLNVGDIVDLPIPAAEMMVAERWGEYIEDAGPVVTLIKPAVAS